MADVPPVIPEGFQAMGDAAVGAFFGLLNLLGAALLQILQWGERSRINGLHKLQIPEALTLLNRS